jgi:hypothetical protein
VDYKAKLKTVIQKLLSEDGTFLEILAEVTKEQK